MIKTHEGKNRILFIFLGGAAIAGWLVFSPLGVIVFAVFGLSVYLINKYAPQDSKAFLIRLLIAGFAIRVILAVLNYFIGLAGAYHGCDTQADAIVYNANAFYLAHAARGISMSQDLFREPYLACAFRQKMAIYAGHIPPPGEYQFGSYVRFIGTIYAYMGYSPIAAKFINSLVSSISAIVVYFISKKMTGSEISSRVSACIVMFFPSMVYWAATLLQDPIVNFLLLLCILAFVVYIDKDKVLPLAFAAICCGLLAMLKVRMGLLLFMGSFIFIAAKIARALVVKGKAAKTIAVLCLIAILLILATAGGHMTTEAIKCGLTDIFRIHKNTVTIHTSASTYKLYDEEVYNDSSMISLDDILNNRLGFAILKSLAYYFLSPFPWSVPRLQPLLIMFYPQVIFNFIAIPFALIGIAKSLQYKKAETLSLILMLVLLVVPQAMTEGIIGNVVRHRDAFMPFVIIFASFGFFSVKPYKKHT